MELDPFCLKYRLYLVWTPSLAMWMNHTPATWPARPNSYGCNSQLSGGSHNYTSGYLDAIKHRLLSANPNCSPRASVSEVHLRIHETVLIVH